MLRSESSPGKSVILAVTGASGAIFARRMFQLLEADNRVARIHLVISGSGLKVMCEELDLDVTRSSEIPSALAAKTVAKTVYLLDSDIGASIASGSYPVDGMVVSPAPPVAWRKSPTESRKHSSNALPTFA